MGYSRKRCQSDTHGQRKTRTKTENEERKIRLPFHRNNKTKQRGIRHFEAVASGVEFRTAVSWDDFKVKA